MAEQPIKKEQVLEPGLFDDAIKGADAFIESSKILEKQLKVNLELSKSYLTAFKGDSSKALREQDKVAKETTNTLIRLEKVEQEIAKTEKIRSQAIREKIKNEELAAKSVEKLAKEQIKAAKDLEKSTSLYSKLSKTLNDQRKVYKDLVLAKKEDTAEGRKTLAQIQKLDSALKKADASVGQFQRNVGNYPKALSGIGTKIAGAFSVGAIVNFGQKILETRAEFQKFEAVLTNTLGSNSAAQSVLSRIQILAAKTPFSVKELTESFVKLANQGFKPTNDELIKLGDLAASQGKSFDQLTEGIIDAQTGEFERLKEFGIRASKEGDKVRFTFKGVQTQTDFNSASIQKYILSLGELEGVSGGMAAISDTLGGKISNLGDNFDTFFNNLGESSEGIFAFFLDQFNDFLGQLNESQTLLNKIDRVLKSKGGGQTYLDKVFGGNTQLTALQQNLDKIANSGKSAIEIQKAYQSALSIVNDQYEEGTITAKEYQNSIFLIGEAVKTEQEIINESNKSKTKNAELTKEQIKLAKELAKANKDLNNQLEKIRIDTTTLDQRREEDNARNEFRLAKEQLAESVGNQETKNKILANLEIKLQQDLIDIRNKYSNEERNRVKKEQDDLKDLELKTEQDFVDKITKEASDTEKIAAEKIAAEKKKQDDIKAKRQKEYEEAVAFSQKIIDIAIAEQQKKADLRQQEFDKQIDEREDNIDKQRALAEKGLANALAFEEAQKTKLELAKKQQAEQDKKIEKGLAFLRLLSGYAEKEPDKALAFAIRDMAIAEVISGAFYEGTEGDKTLGDTLGRTNTKDGHLILADDNERIFNGKNSSKMKGVDSDEVADLVYNYKMGLLDHQMIKVATTPSNDFAKRIDESAKLQQMFGELKKEMSSVKQAIEDKPVMLGIDFDNYGDFTQKTFEKGITRNLKVITRKLRL